MNIFNSVDISRNTIHKIIFIIKKIVIAIVIMNNSYTHINIIKIIPIWIYFFYITDLIN